ncbi:MAG: hypothetical protein HYZ52_02115 [Candidatus Omnitrophica bacterium]|nr:hypothetical protein [Candidatus Omnitrophota bacterium]
MAYFTPEQRLEDALKRIDAAHAGKLLTSFHVGQIADGLAMSQQRNGLLSPAPDISEMLEQHMAKSLDGPNKNMEEFLSLYHQNKEGGNDLRKQLESDGSTFLLNFPRPQGGWAAYPCVFNKAGFASFVADLTEKNSVLARIFLIAVSENLQKTVVSEGRGNPSASRLAVSVGTVEDTGPLNLFATQQKAAALVREINERLARSSIDSETVRAETDGFLNEKVRVSGSVDRSAWVSFFSGIGDLSDGSQARVFLEALLSALISTEETTGQDDVPVTADRINQWLITNGIQAESTKAEVDSDYGRIRIVHFFPRGGPFTILIQGLADSPRARAFLRTALLALVNMDRSVAPARQRISGGSASATTAPVTVSNGDPSAPEIAAPRTDGRGARMADAPEDYGEVHSWKEAFDKARELLNSKALGAVATVSLSEYRSGRYFAAILDVPDYKNRGIDELGYLNQLADISPSLYAGNERFRLIYRSISVEGYGEIKTLVIVYLKSGEIFPQPAARLVATATPARLAERVRGARLGFSDGRRGRGRDRRQTTEDRNQESLKRSAGPAIFENRLRTTGSVSERARLLAEERVGSRRGAIHRAPRTGDGRHRLGAINGAPTLANGFKSLEALLGETPALAAEVGVLAANLARQTNTLDHLIALSILRDQASILRFEENGDTVKIYAHAESGEALLSTVSIQKTILRGQSEQEKAIKLSDLVGAVQQASALNGAEPYRQMLAAPKNVSVYLNGLEGLPPGLKEAVLENMLTNLAARHEKGTQFLLSGDRDLVGLAVHILRENERLSRHRDIFLEEGQAFSDPNANRAYLVFNNYYLQNRALFKGQEDRVVALEDIQESPTQGVAGLDPFGPAATLAQLAALDREKARLFYTSLTGRTWVPGQFFFVPRLTQINVTQAIRAYETTARMAGQSV